MTGRELIIYILANGLEDKPVIEDGKLIGHLNEETVAEDMDVGVATVRTWVKLGFIEGASLGEKVYIPVDVKLE